MSERIFDRVKKPVAALTAAAALMSGCSSEKQSVATAEDIEISSLRNQPMEDRIETDYDVGMRCTLDIGKHAIREVLGQVEGEYGQPGLYRIDPDNKQSSYVMATPLEEGVTNIKLQVALKERGAIAQAPQDEITYAVGGEFTLMQLSTEEWTDALRLTAPSQVCYPNGGLSVSNLKTGEFGNSSDPTSMCEIASQLK